MKSTLTPVSFSDQLAALDPADAQYAVRAVDALIKYGRANRASDLHLQPSADRLNIRARIDGVLQPVAEIPAKVSANCIARLKVLAGLLTYRTDVPQEGRIRGGPGELELRVSTFPTIHGEKAVVRFFSGASNLQELDTLGMPEDLLEDVRRILAETSGALLVTGPAGSGKTTTLYACLREVAAASALGRSIATLEDPVEVVLDGVAQSQVTAEGEFDLAAGLRYLMRQDPEVIMVGEIRDAVTAETALQASLTGHLVLSSFHAGSAAGSLSRLADMGIPPFVLRGGVLGVLSQRLARRLCDCKRETTTPADFLGLNVSKAWMAAGCDLCQQTGYRGRLMLAELMLLDRHGLAPLILAGADMAQLDAAARAEGMVSRRDRAVRAVADGLTSPQEVLRIYGLHDL